jgi:hypothetical protein
MFKPDRLVISTLREADSAWLHGDVLDRGRAASSAIPITTSSFKRSPRLLVSRLDGSAPELGGSR